MSLLCFNVLKLLPQVPISEYELSNNQRYKQFLFGYETIAPILKSKYYAISPKRKKNLKFLENIFIQIRGFGWKNTF
jgi:DNA-binding PadR family transcriptional regulator